MSFVIVSFTSAVATICDHFGWAYLDSPRYPFKDRQEAEQHCNLQGEVHPWPLPPDVVSRLKARYPMQDWAHVPEPMAELSEVETLQIQIKHLRAQIERLQAEGRSNRLTASEMSALRDEVAKLTRERDEARVQLESFETVRPFHEWNDADGAVLWYLLPVCEPAFHVGTPSDSDWPWDGDTPEAKIGWTRIPNPCRGGAQ
jgi:hypothetical protein